MAKTAAAADDGGDTRNAETRAGIPADDSWAIATITSNALVQRLRNPKDEEAWFLVVERYGPMVEGFARNLGLSFESAEDARQESMAAFVEAIRAGHYEGDRPGARLRKYLFGIAKRKALDTIEKEIKHRLVGLQPDRSSFIEKVPADEDCEEAWTQAELVAIAAQCLHEARARFDPRTYEMYYKHAILGTPSKEVAEEMGVTAQAVDMATHRVREFLRAMHPRIEEIL